jgi:hypothetical protein
MSFSPNLLKPQRNHLLILQGKREWPQSDGKCKLVNGHSAVLVNSDKHIDLFTGQSLSQSHCPANSNVIKNTLWILLSNHDLPSLLIPMSADRSEAIVEPFSIGRSQAISCDFDEKFLNSENGRTLIVEI